MYSQEDIGRSCVFETEKFITEKAEQALRFFFGETPW